MRTRRRTMTIATVAAAFAAATAACSSGETTSADPLGSPAMPSSGAPDASITPGQAIWVAVLAEGPDAQALEPDLASARQAVGDYLAERVVISEPACFEGIGSEVEGPAIVAIRDTAEHGVHAMFLEITDDPLFYGPVTLAC